VSAGAGPCSRGPRPRPLYKFVAGGGDPGARPSTAATTFADPRNWTRQVISAIVILFIVSCANFSAPPDVSPALVANARPDHVDAEQLQNGRRLFVSRCLECHTLPQVTKYNREQWPHLVSRMSGRANLSASEQNAIVAYLRAASLTNH
jgi:cytochrome c1